MSDHISGPRALADPIADITDVYAFPSPDRPGWLVLVMNTMPFAEPEARFSDGLVYRFRLRPVEVDLIGGRAVADGHGPTEWVFNCVFDTTGSEGIQEGRCTQGNGDVTRCVVGDAAGGESSAIRMFAGPRWDPFIMDAPAGLRTIAEQRLSFNDPGSIFLDGKNVLSLVIELDCAVVLGQPGPVGVVAETLTRGALEVRIERVGRPEVKNLLLAPKQFDQVNRDLEIRDLYNMEDGFHLGSSYGGAYRARLNANLAFWDGLDGDVHWPLSATGDHPLTEMVLADYLVVDPDKPYAEHGSFLEIERATREGRAHETCGGRTLNDDVIDVLYTLWINGGAGPVISDGVHAASRPATTTFPYLVPANPSPPVVPEHF